MNNVHVPVCVCVGHLIYRHYAELPLCNRNIYMGQSPEQGPLFMLCPLTTDAWYRILLREKCDVRMSGAVFTRPPMIHISMYLLSFLANSVCVASPVASFLATKAFCHASTNGLMVAGGPLRCWHRGLPLLFSPVQKGRWVNVASVLRMTRCQRTTPILFPTVLEYNPVHVPQKWGLWKRWAWCWSWAETVLQLSCEAGPSPAFRQTSKGLILQLPWWKKRKGQGEGGGNL